MIIIPSRQLEVVRSEAGRGYPEEVCGVLIGRNGDPFSRKIVQVVPVANSRRVSRSRRYVIDADTLLGVERTARAEGLDVLGFYHSHPDHPAVPSDFDREHSWPWYSYMIVSVAVGVPGEVRAWKLSADRSGFQEEEIAEETP